MTKCYECDWCVATHTDPRDPPLDDRACLCTSCYKDAAEQVIEELEERIIELKETLK